MLAVGKRAARCPMVWLKRWRMAATVAGGTGDEPAHVHPWRPSYLPTVLYDVTTMKIEHPLLSGLWLAGMVEVLPAIARIPHQAVISRLMMNSL